MFESLNKDSCTRLDLSVDRFRRAPLVEMRSKRWSIVVRSLVLCTKCISWNSSMRVRCKKMIAACIRSRCPTLGKTSSNPGILIKKFWHFRVNKHRLAGLKPYLVRRSLASLRKFYIKHRSYVVSIHVKGAFIWRYMCLWYCLQMLSCTCVLITDTFMNMCNRCFNNQLKMFSKRL